MSEIKRPIWAALDLGTSKIKASIWHPEIGFEVVVAVDTPVVFGAGGQALCNYRQLWEAVEEIGVQLGRRIRAAGATSVELGLCGQVSSLLAWDSARAQPLEECFQIWADTTCQPSLPALEAFFAKGQDVKLLNTPLPPGTNWLAVKLHHFLQQQEAVGVRFLQIHDAVFQALSGSTLTHASGQVSLVDQEKLEYADPLLRFLGITRAHLPCIDNTARAPIKSAWRQRWGWPKEGRVYVGLADMSAAFMGLFLGAQEGCWLANTAEILGVFSSTRRAGPPPRLVSAALAQGWITYGSTATGGHNINWFLEQVLKRDTAALTSLTQEAEEIEPGCGGLVFLPYLAGERAPLWDASLSAAFVGLRSYHSDAHLFRAVLEGVALGKRQIIESWGMPHPTVYKLAGGSSTNALWNRIRAAVVETPLALCAQEELSLLGTLRFVLEQSGNAALVCQLESLLAPEPILPDPAWSAIYKQRYNKFIHVQKALATF